MGDKEFSKYILPENDVPDDASKVNGLAKKDGHLYLWGKRVETSDAKEVIGTFVEFLKKVSEGKPVALIAHNGSRFDFFIIIRDMERHGLLESFYDTVVGFIDTIPVMRSTVPVWKTYQLKSLAERFGVHTDHAHDALGDVRILEQIIKKAVISDSMLRRYTMSIAQVALGGQFQLKSRNYVVKYGLNILTPTVPHELTKRLAQKKITLELLQMTSENDDAFRSLVSIASRQPDDLRTLKDAVKKSILES